MEARRRRSVPSIRVFKVFAAFGTVAFILASVAVAAGDPGDTGIPDNLEARTARNVLTHSAPDSFFIRSQSVGAVQDDVFEVAFDEGRFEIAYAPVADGPNALSYSLEFKSISEVRADPSGEITETIGEPVDLSSTYAVTPMSAAASDGRAIPGFRASTNGGLFAVTVWSGDRFFQMGDALVSPTEVKVDIEIRGWILRETGTSLALRMDLSPSTTSRANCSMELRERSGDEERGWASNESEMMVASENHTVFFSWSRTAVVSSTTSTSHPVRMTPIEELADGYESSFLYDLGQQARGNAIAVVTHDPKMGVVSAAFWAIWNAPPPLQADALLYGAGIALIAAVIAGTVVARRRRRAP